MGPFNLELAFPLLCREEKTAIQGDSANPGARTATNAELGSLVAELRQVARSSGDGFLLYLYGVVLRDSGQLGEAREVLVASVHAYPCNWAAWEALGGCCAGLAAARALDLPAHVCRDFWLAALAVDLHAGEEALGVLSTLAPRFPASDELVSLAAAAHYGLQNFDEAQELYEDLLARNPHRLEGMDLYSNILYVKEQAPALSALAHAAVNRDRYRPETCCIVGNYYSLRGQHERAALYFRRALRLSPDWLTAWTLMGHEYVELKNPPAAIGNVSIKRARVSFAFQEGIDLISPVIIWTALLTILQKRIGELSI